MVEVFEREVTCAEGEPSAVHQLLHGIVYSPGECTTRPYHWCRLGRNRVLVRSGKPDLLPLLRPVAIPRVGTRIEFRLRAHLRTGSRARHAGHRHQPARPLVGDPANLLWMLRAAGDAGLSLRGDDVNYESDVLTIARATGPLRQHLALFHGFATVTDNERLGAALATGLGGMRAFGCGLLQFRAI